MPHANPKAQPEGKVVASCHWDFDGDQGATERRIGGKEMLSNARLLAAAPDMIKALVAVEEAYERFHAEPTWEVSLEDFMNRSNVRKLVRAAIEKASGV